MNGKDDFGRTILFTVQNVSRKIEFEVKYLMDMYLEIKTQFEKIVMRKMQLKWLHI